MNHMENLVVLLFNRPSSFHAGAPFQVVALEVENSIVTSSHSLYVKKLFMQFAVFHMSFCYNNAKDSKMTSVIP